MAAGRGGSREPHVRRACAARGPEAAERGLTLVEMVVTVFVLGLVATAFATALIAMIGAADQQRRSSLADAALRRDADWLAGRDYVDCATTHQYGPLPVADAGDTIDTIDAVEYSTTSLRSSDPPFPKGGSVGWSGANDPTGTTCAGAPPVDPGLQRVEVTVRVGALSRSRWVVKRRDAQG